MGNSAPSLFYLCKVNFTRKTPNDFYSSGDRVQGIIEILINDTDDDFNLKYGPLHVELIGELCDFKVDIFQTHGKRDRIFFRKRAQLIKLPNDHQQLGTRCLQHHRWAFDALLDAILPSSLLPYDECDACICYYAYAYLRHNDYLTKKSSFLVFTRTPMTDLIRQSLHNYVTEASVQHKNVKLYGSLPNNGLAVPGQTLKLQIEIDNPMKLTIKSIRATLKQYRNIVDEVSNITIFSYMLPGFKSEKFNSEYRQNTYELALPLEKCPLMAPTSYHKNVRYKLHIQCHLYCTFNNHFTLTLPIICNTDNQSALKIMDELKSLLTILRNLSNTREDMSLPSYEDFIASEILPIYEDIIH